MKYDWHPIINSDLENLRRICPVDEYRIYSGGEIQPFLFGMLPERLTNQYDSVFIAGSAAPGGITYYMANGNRIDSKKREIDQMPLGLVFIGNNASGSACLIHHGHYTHRTITPLPGFWNYVANNKIASGRMRSILTASFLSIRNPIQNRYI